MKATRVLLGRLILPAALVVLAACSLPAPLGRPSLSALPAAEVISAAQPGAAPQGALAAAPTDATQPPALTPPPARSETQPARPTRAAPGTFDLGVPAGDAHYPYSLALDSARNLAYVYHADSAEQRPVISVVDLAASKVLRLIRLAPTTPAGPGRVFLAPDGRRLFWLDRQSNTLWLVDATTGAVRKLLEGALEGVLSDDGRLMYLAQSEALAAYTVADLIAGGTNPVWQAKGRYVRLAFGRNRVLAATYERTAALTAFDAVTGKEVARGDAPETADAVAAGPNGAWAILVSGETPRLIRYDAGLKILGETPVVYGSEITYDAGRERYLLGGRRYTESTPRGRAVVVAVAARSGQADDVTWPGDSAPTIFAPWGRDALVAFSQGGPGRLAVLAADTLAARAEIVTGVRAVDVILDDKAQRLYVADDLERIHVLQLPGGEELALWQGAPPFALDRGHGRLYVNRATGVVALDLADGAVLAQFPQKGDPAPDPAADLVYLVDNGVTVYDRSAKRITALPSTFPVERGFSPNPSAYAARVNPVTGHVAVITSNGVPGSNGGSFLRIYDRQSDKFVEPPAPHSFVMDLTTDSQGNWYVAYSTVRNQEALQVLTPDGRELRRLDHRTGYLVLGEEQDRLYLFLHGRVTQATSSSLTPTAVLAATEESDTFAFSARGRMLYFVGGHRALVRTLSLDSLQPVDLQPAPGRPPVEAWNDGVAVVADAGKRFVFGRYGRVFRTTDGNTWDQLLPGLELNYAYLTAVSPRTVFAAGYSPVGGEGVWRSTDGGETWTWLTAGLTDMVPLAPVMARGPDEVYFLNRGQGLLRWDAGRGRWQVVSQPAQDGQWGGVTLAPDGSLFRSSEGNLEQSKDRGASWTRLGPIEKTGEIIGFSALYTTTNTLFSVVRANYQITAIQRSTDGGKTWQKSNVGAVNFDGYTPELVTGFGRSYLLLRRYTGEPTLLRTTNYGDTWEVAPAGTAAGVDHVAVDPSDGRLWLGQKGGVRSVDPTALRWARVGQVQATPTRRASPTPPPPPAATPTVGPCRQPLTGNDAEINGRSLGLGCPRGAAENIQMARERFQNGQMIWRQDRRWIYVLYNDGRWEGYPDRWVEGDPADDPTLAPPGGLQQPVRGFGKVWRENLGGGRAAIGWALEPEQGLLAQAQDWDYGTVLRFGGEVIVLFDRGRWR